MPYLPQTSDLEEIDSQIVNGEVETVEEDGEEVMIVNAEVEAATGEDTEEITGGHIMNAEEEGEEVVVEEDTEEVTEMTIVDVMIDMMEVADTRAVVDMVVAMEDIVIAMVEVAGIQGGVVAVAAVTALVGEAVVDTAPTGTTQAGVVDVTKKKKMNTSFQLLIL